MPGMEGIVSEPAPAYTKIVYTREYILTGSRNISVEAFRIDAASH